MGFTKDLAQDTLQGGSGVLIGLLLLGAGLVAFFVLGDRFAFWSPGLLGVFWGLGALVMLYRTRLIRFTLALVTGLAGGGAAMLLGSTEGLGLQIALGTLAIVFLLYHWSVVHVFADIW